MYYGYGYNYYDLLSRNLYLLLLLPVLGLSFWAQVQVNGNFKKYGKVFNRRGITGAQAAETVLRAAGVYDVPVRMVGGNLTDHYDPRDNTIYLSENVYGASSVSAVGVAAHEAGHAVQYAEGYLPVRFRMSIVPLTQLASKFAFFALFLGMVLYISKLLLVGVVLFSVTTLFQLVTLPVELDASSRALHTIRETGMLSEEEQHGAKKVLRAAALTYVAALLMSALELLRYVLIFMSRSGNGRRGRR